MLKTILSISTLLVVYLLFWPVAVQPISWDAPEAPGYQGPFAQNNVLAQVEKLDIAGTHGPEALAIPYIHYPDVLDDSIIYASTHEGWILRIDAKTGKADKWVNTGGRPLGIVFDRNNNLLVADAFEGLLQISTQGLMTVLSKQVNGKPIDYADDLDIGSDGKIYFSDASSKFGAKAYGGTYQASLLDLMEHGGHGRLLVYNPADQSTQVLMSGLNFANGVAVDSQSRFVLVNETGSYRIHKYWISGERQGQSDILIDNLPGFPDNIVRGVDDRFWVGLVSPRNSALDNLSDSPFIRKIVQRLPAFMRPQAQLYSHVFAMDGQGNVLQSLQDPSGDYHTNTGALETNNWLYISSLHEDELARLKWTDGYKISSGTVLPNDTDPAVR